MPSISAKGFRLAIKQRFLATRKRWLPAMDAAWQAIMEGVVKHLTAENDPTLFLSSTGEWLEASSGVGVTDGDKGDITVSGAGANWSIDNGVVTPAKQAAYNADSFLGNTNAFPATPIYLTWSDLQVLVPAFSEDVNGMVPAPGLADGTKYLRDDGTWQVVSAGGDPRRFRYTCNGTEGSDFMITIAGGARATDTYNVQMTMVNATALLSFCCPDSVAGDRTTTQFKVVTSAAVANGDSFDIVVQDNT